jgi:predicted N-acyltransferase
MTTYTSKVYNTVEDIEPHMWEELNCTSNRYFSPNFLWAYESSNHNIDFKYIIIRSNETAIALAIIQTIELDVDVILKNIKLTKWLKKLLRFLFKRSPIRIMFCGNIFLSGEHGIFVLDLANKKEVYDQIGVDILKLAKQMRPLHAMFVKDFVENSLEFSHELKIYGFGEMQVEPNLIISIDPSWKTFDDYKNHLKSKYRIKVNKADSTSSSLNAVMFNEDDFANHKYELQELYQNTIANANFNAQVLNLDTYIKLRSIYKEDFIVKAYFLKDKLVGFLSALANNNHLDAHFIGLDYELNKTYAIYPRILNDYVRLGIEKGASHINLGRTASEIKTTIGAEPTNITCYIRHRRPFLNRLIQPFIKNVRIKDFKRHYPFKGQKKEV